MHALIILATLLHYYCRQFNNFIFNIHSFTVLNNILHKIRCTVLFCVGFIKYQYDVGFKHFFLMDFCNIWGLKVRRTTIEIPTKGRQTDTKSIIYQSSDSTSSS